MSLEACLICIDNSEHMRNGDFVPTRFEAQHDAVNLIAGAKTQQHPESAIGVLAMASKTKSVEVLVNLTTDFGAVLTNVHKAQIGGIISFSASLNVARLALKHRQNKNQKQRIVVFVGSPLVEDAKQLAALGKKLKKNNVCVDVVNFGQEEENTDKLEAFVGAVDRDGTSHLVTVPPGPHILSDILVSSPIVRGDAGDGATGGGGGGEGGGFPGGVDPELDPELAMALRLSMEEHEREQQRQQEQGGSAQPAEGEAAQPSGATPQAAPPGEGAGAGMEMEMEGDELDEQLRLAIEMSLAEANANPEGSVPAGSSVRVDMDDEEEDREQDAHLLSDPELLNSVLSGLPGVDLSDPRVRNAIGKGKDGDEEMEEGDGKEEEEEKKE